MLQQVRTAFEPTKWPILDITSSTNPDDNKGEQPNTSEDKPKTPEADADKETVKEEAPSIEANTERVENVEEKKFDNIVKEPTITTVEKFEVCTLLLI